MNAVVVAASRHGSTREIAQVIADELRRAGIETALRDARTVEEIGGYDAVILGSAVYMGNWLPEARRFGEHNLTQLTTVPLWLFSSGPLGADDPQPHGDPERISDLLRNLRPREHKVFAGKLDKRGLGFGERLAVKAVKAQEGDFRDWDAVRGWAHAIADALTTGATVRA
ncbi:MAG: flavodoxin domain-containing protein [Dehalococcoidia bacterium]